MPRKSKAALEVVRSGLVDVVDRPAPPPELSPEHARVWVQVTEALPADWFGAETLGLLTQYCRHTVTASRVAAMIVAAELDESTTIEDLDRLYKMQEREGRALSSLATRMRMTQQTTYHQGKTKGKKQPAKKPWQG